MTESRDGMVKVLFDAEGINETLWAEEVEPGRYRLDNSPFFAYGVSADDIVEAEPTDYEGTFRFLEAKEKSGNQTIRVYSGSIDIEDETFKPTLEAIKELGCDYEGFAPKMVSINIPKGLGWEKVGEYLSGQKLMWEHGDPTYDQLHKPSAEA